MKELRIVAVLGVVVGLFGLHEQRTIAATVSYTIQSLGTLPGGISSEAEDINNSGQVTGSSVVQTTQGTPHAFIWQNGTMTDLGSNTLYGHAINSSGQIAGEMESTAFEYSGGAVTNLGLSPTGGQTTAYGINDAGQVVGFAGNDFNNPGGYAALWSGGTLTALTTPTPGVDSGIANDINDSGEVVGGTPNGVAIWQNGVETDLGTFGGSSAGANAINASGQIVGSIGLTNTNATAFVWTPSSPNGTSGTERTLSAPSGTWESTTADDINGGGTIVGSGIEVTKKGSVRHAILWRNGSAIDLNSVLPSRSGWVLTEARAINDKGQIVGVGTLNGQGLGFLLTPPTPTPFLALPFNYTDLQNDGFAINWSDPALSTGIKSFFDHDYPNYQKDGTIQLFDGTTISFDPNNPASEDCADPPANTTACGYWYQRRADALGSAYGYVYYDGHDGIDFPLHFGQNVQAAAAGTVVRVDSQAPYPSCFGMMVEIDHANGYVTLYGHLSSVSTAVGKKVKAGAVIGTVGSTVGGSCGTSTAAHLHFGVYPGSGAMNPSTTQPVDPFGFLCTGWLWKVASCSGHP